MTNPLIGTQMNKANVKIEPSIPSQLTKQVHNSVKSKCRLFLI